jgi:large conductance mechanosensitive channel
MLKEFKQFAMRGNVVDMAVGIIIGAAFGAIVTSFVNDILMPVIGLALGGTDFSNMFVVLRQGSSPPAGEGYASLKAAKDGGAVIFAYGALINTIINFLIVAFALFMLIKAMNTARREQAAAPPAPPPPSNEERLLTDIRDILAGRSQKV